MILDRLAEAIIGPLVALALVGLVAALFVLPLLALGAFSVGDTRTALWCLGGEAVALFVLFQIQ